MDVVTRIGSGKAQHYASYNRSEGTIKLLCNLLKYGNYFADIKEYEAPTAKNVTCKKCLKLMEGL